MAKVEYEIESFDELTELVGNLDKNIKIISEDMNVRVAVGNNTLVIEGEETDTSKTVRLLDALLEYKRSGNEINETTIKICEDLTEKGKEFDIHKLNEVIAVTARGKQIKCKSAGQINYIKSINRNSVVFGIGPAGTGKTYLAVALATMAFKSREVEKIILTRPAVEAGEKLGFLPGDLGAKVDPYLRPLYDALEEMFGVENYQKLIEKGVVEIAPLAYMRGRTLSNSFIILDEAQNATREQMKMFLTRMGEGSKIVVTGDVTQIDLPFDKQSGLVDASEILQGIEGIGIVKLSDKDVVRHPLVKKIVKAYDEAERLREEKRAKRLNEKKNGEEGL